jgi:hypothetical protein
MVQVLLSVELEHIQKRRNEEIVLPGLWFYDQGRHRAVGDDKGAHAS